MKIKKLRIPALVLTVLGALAMSQSYSDKIETSIAIEGSPEQIWNKMTEFENYSQWNPFIKSIEGDLKVGNSLKVFIQPQGEDGMKFTPTVLNAEENKELRWVGKLLVKGIFDGEHYFRLEKMPNGQTMLVHGEEFRGILVPLLWPIIKESTTKGFVDHNQAIKKLVESEIIISSR